MSGYLATLITSLCEKSAGWSVEYPGIFLGKAKSLIYIHTQKFHRKLPEVRTFFCIEAFLGKIEGLRVGLQPPVTFLRWSKSQTTENFKILIFSSTLPCCHCGVKTSSLQIGKIFTSGKKHLKRRILLWKCESMSKRLVFIRWRLENFLNTVSSIHINQFKRFIASHKNLLNLHLQDFHTTMTI